MSSFPGRVPGEAKVVTGPMVFTVSMCQRLLGSVDAVLSSRYLVPPTPTPRAGSLVVARGWPGPREQVCGPRPGHLVRRVCGARAGRGEQEPVVSVRMSRSGDQAVWLSRERPLASE